MDAEKAFEQVNWTFLFRTLEHIGLGGTMFSWVKSLYTVHSQVHK